MNTPQYFQKISAGVSLVILAIGFSVFCQWYLYLIYIEHVTSGLKDVSENCCPHIALILIRFWELCSVRLNILCSKQLLSFEWKNEERTERNDFLCVLVGLSAPVGNASHQLRLQVVRLTPTSRKASAKSTIGQLDSQSWEYFIYCL